MAELRLYDEAMLALCSKQDLEKKLIMVETSVELTREEVIQNIDRIKFALGGGVHYTHKDTLEDIEAGAADISDIGGNWRGKK